MFLTSREQKLIQTFLKRGKLTIAEMMEITDTSRRTLYRDLNNLQKSLPENLSLENTDEGYFLKGDINQLAQVHELIDYSISERLYGELLLLIENKASIASLTDYFGISQPTVTSDLKQIKGHSDWVQMIHHQNGFQREKTSTLNQNHLIEIS